VRQKGGGGKKSPKGLFWNILGVIRVGVYSQGWDKRDVLLGTSLIFATRSHSHFGGRAHAHATLDLEQVVSAHLWFTSATGWTG